LKKLNTDVVLRKQ